MPKTPPSRHPRDLLMRLDGLVKEDPARGAFTVEDLSARMFSRRFGGAFEFVQARFTGALPSAHSIPVRGSTTILNSLQETISEVGAVIAGVSPKRGPLPARVVAETELNLSPRVRPGSVIFVMTPAVDESLFGRPQLLNDSLQQIFTLFDLVERPESTHLLGGDVVGTLRTFGPRAARHLVKFASSLNELGLNVDLGFSNEDSSMRESRVSRSGARHLKSLAKDATKRTVETVLTGEVHNLGTDHLYKIDTDDRGRVSVRGDDGITDILQKAFRKSRVVVDVSETESVNVATGKATSTFKAKSARIVAE